MAWKQVNLIGFAPDAPPTTEGDCLLTSWVVPTDRGFGPIPIVSEGSSSATNTVSLGGAVVFQTNNTQRTFVGTATKQYEFNSTGSSITDRSGMAYSASTTDTWSYTQFGDVTLTINKNDFLQQINAGGAFAAVGIAPTPKAAIIVTCGPVSASVCMVFDYDDGTNNYRDGWFASGLNNPLNVTGWTTGTNQCANGRLLDDIPGPITAAIAYRDDVVAFKRTGMYIGNYTGRVENPWDWRRLSHDIGCVGKNCVVQADDVIYWADDSAVWMYDGSYPRKIPGQVHNWWTSVIAGYAVTAENRNFCRAIWDKQKHLLYVLSGLVSSGVPVVGLGLAWNAISGLWTQKASLNLTVPPFFHLFGTADDSLFISEIFHPRYGVTNNKKLGLLTWGSNATEPHTGFLYGWCITDMVHPPILNGLRPHWIRSNGTATWAYGNFVTFTSMRDFVDLTRGAAYATNTAALTFEEPGHLFGKLSGEVMTYALGAVAGCDWEISRVLSIDIAAQGKT